MSILQSDMPLICIIASQNVTFLFRRPNNVWRTIGWCFFFRQSFRAAASHYIISNRAVNSCLSPHIAVSGQCAIFLSGDEKEEVGVYCRQRCDDFTFSSLLLFTNRGNKEMTAACALCYILYHPAVPYTHSAGRLHPSLLLAQAGKVGKSVLGA